MYAAWFFICRPEEWPGGCNMAIASNPGKKSSRGAVCTESAAIAQVRTTRQTAVAMKAPYQPSFRVSQALKSFRQPMSSHHLKKRRQVYLMPCSQRIYINSRIVANRKLHHYPVTNSLRQSTRLGWNDLQR